MSSISSHKASSSSSFSSSTCQWKYDVFLSFRGKDTRTSFTDHLYVASKQRGIVTFGDKENLDIASRKIYFTKTFESNKRIEICNCHSLKKLCIINMVLGWTYKDNWMPEREDHDCFANFLWCGPIWCTKTNRHLCPSLL